MFWKKPVIVAINQFTHDTEAELNFLKTWCEDNNHPCEIANVWLNGGAAAKASMSCLQQS